jgi:hypothetical protein
MYLAIIELTQTHQCNKSLTKSKTTEINLWFYLPIDWYNQKMKLLEVCVHAWMMHALLVSMKFSNVQFLMEPKKAQYMDLVMQDPRK